MGGQEWCYQTYKVPTDPSQYSCCLDHSIRSFTIRRSGGYQRGSTPDTWYMIMDPVIWKFDTLDDEREDRQSVKDFATALRGQGIQQHRPDLSFNPLVSQMPRGEGVQIAQEGRIR